VKEAATVLGYERKLWDEGLEMSELDVYWDELPDEKKNAAVILGYSEQK
jgi:hypothetical protein